METTADLAAILTAQPSFTPKAKPRGRPFNSATAKIYSPIGAAASVAARKLPKPLPTPMAQLVLEPQLKPPALSDIDRAKFTRRLQGQLTRLYALLDGAISGNVRELGEEGECLIIEPKGIKALSDAIRGLEACYWRYAGIPGEGTLKPQQPKQKDSRFDGLPVRPL